MLRKAGIAEQMKQGPSQGSCDMKHGVGYWGDIPSGFNGILESLSTMRAAGQNQRFGCTLSWTRLGALCSQTSTGPFPPPLPSDLPRGSRWNPRPSCAVPTLALPPAASQDPSPPPASLHLPGEQRGVTSQPPIPAILLGPQHQEGEVLALPLLPGNRDMESRGDTGLQFPSFHLH